MRPILLLVRVPHWDGFARMRYLACCALFAGLAWTRPAAAAPVIDVLVSEPTGIYQQTATSFAQALDAEGWTIRVSTPERSGAGSAELTVAVGTRALETALTRPNRPVLSLLVPRLTYERLAAGKDRVSALYLDQPLQRQLQLLGLALPGLKRVGVPLGPSSQAQEQALQRAARATGIEVGSVPIRRSQDLPAALEALAGDSQAFVLLPDPVVAQRTTLQNLLLHTYRLKKPVLAYSAPLAQSGALLALYATPAQLGEEAAVWIRESWGSDFRLAAPRYPRRFTVAVNRTVARALDLNVPDEDVLTRRLEAMQ